MSFKRCQSLRRLVILLFFLVASARCVDSDGKQFPTAPAFSNSTARPSLVVPTPTANGTDSDYVNKCWSSWDAWSTSSKDCRLTTTSTGTVAFTEERSSVIYETYKLCDGHPRANATAGESTSRTTASESGTAWATFTEVLPPSGIPESTITTLVTSRATLYETACATSLASPKCSIGVEDCPSLFSAWTAGGFKRGRPPCTFAMLADPCDDCAIYIPTVQLLYFPVSMTGDFCRDYSTATPTYAANISYPTTVLISGHTLTSGSAYLSYAGITARAGQNRQCGTPLPAGILGLPSSRLSTYRGHAAAMPIVSLPPHSLNFADLAPNPVPWDAWISQETCVTNQETATCQTITQAAYRPWIVYPHEFWEKEPKWSKCGSDVFGIMDPPSALPLAQEVPQPTMPTVTGNEGAETTGRPLPSAVAPQPTADATHTKASTQRAPASSSHQAPDSSNVEGQDPAATTPQEPSRSGEESKPLASETAPGLFGATARDPPAAEPSSTIHQTRITASFTYKPVPGSEVHPSSQSVVIPTHSAEGSRSRGTRTDPDHDPASDSPQQTTGYATHDAGGPALTAPGLSILASALSPRISAAEPSLASKMSSVMSEADSVLHPNWPDASNPEQSATGVQDPTIASSSHTTMPIIVTFGNNPYTLHRANSGHLVFGSATLAPGDVTTISGVPVAAYSSAVLIGSTFLPLLQLVTHSGGTGKSKEVSSTSGADVLPSIVEPSRTASSEELPGLTTAFATTTSATGDIGGGDESAGPEGQPGVTTIGIENSAARSRLWQGVWISCLVVATGVILL